MSDAIDLKKWGDVEYYLFIYPCKLMLVPGIALLAPAQLAPLLTACPCINVSHSLCSRYHYYN